MILSRSLNEIDFVGFSNVSVLERENVGCSLKVTVACLFKVVILLPSWRDVMEDEKEEVSPKSFRVEDIS